MLETHLFAAAKDGALPEDWEDSAASSRSTGRFAIADGASSSFAAKQWGRLLTERWITDPPENNPDGFASWLKRSRAVWKTQLSQITSDVPTYLQRHREADARGSHATFLGCGTTPLQNGAIGVQVTAVGDSCLFQVRDGKVTNTSPADLLTMEFDSYPNLICSIDEGKDTEPTNLKLTAKPGDILYLASDAIAEAIRDAHQAESNVWVNLDRLTSKGFSSLVPRLRDSGMVNDDVTLLRCRLGDPGAVQIDEVTREL